MRAEKTKAKQTAMNQSMAVAYDTFGKECRALMLKVVMVKTVVIPKMGENEKCSLSAWNPVTTLHENMLVEGSKLSPNVIIVTIYNCSRLLIIGVISFVSFNS